MGSLAPGTCQPDLDAPSTSWSDFVLGFSTGMKNQKQSLTPRLQSVLPFLHAVRSPERRLLWYEGDTGVALRHVGMLVGRSAHQRVWPEILRWIHARVIPGREGGRRGESGGVAEGRG